MKKKITKLFIIICLLGITRVVYAAGINPSGITQSNNNYSSSTSLDGVPGANGKRGTQVGNHNYVCYYNAGNSQQTTINMNAYDLNGNSLIPYNFTTTHKVDAGTWVGINGMEVKTSSWWISNFTYYELKKKYTCYYSKPGDCTTTCTTEVRTGHGNSCSCKPGWTVYSPLRMENGGNTCRIGCINYNDCTTTCEDDAIAQETITKLYYDNVTTADCPNKNGYRKDRVEFLEEVKVAAGTVNQCKNEATSAIRASAQGYVNHPSNVMEYIYTNFSTNMSNQSSIYKIGAKLVSESETSSAVSGGSGGSFIKEYNFTPEKVCINVKTASVQYAVAANDNVEGYDYCSKFKDDEVMYIANDTVYEPSLNKEIEYWHYFIPLDAKGNQTFFIRLRENTGGEINEPQCQSVMESHRNDYTTLIKPLRSASFAGDYARGSQSIDLKKVSDDGGCYIAITVNFQINQKFYNEKTTNNVTKISGYGVNYRPIDITNPFPNGLSSNSYWNHDNTRYEQRGSGGNIITITDASNNAIKYNLNESFKTLSYKIYMNNSVINDIKSFNKDTSKSDGMYTSWKAMQNDGTSSFISQYNGFRRNGTNSYYRLGCGPSNSNWRECK